jgi:hypothetical protein
LHRELPVAANRRRLGHKNVFSAKLSRLIPSDYILNPGHNNQMLGGIYLESGRVW